jgi:Ca-activated chloride channel homolog
MGKHAVPVGDDEPVLASSGSSLTGRLALVSAAVVTIVGAAVLVGPREAIDRLPWVSASSSCTGENVNIVVDPDLQTVVDRIVDPVRGNDLPGGGCVAVQVRAQESQVTSASANILPLDRAPQIWIPDASLWGERTTAWKTTSAGSLASTPVVMASSKAAAEGFGWDNHDPTWHMVMRGKRPVAVPDYQAQSQSLDALLTLWKTLGKDTDADNAVVATVVASDREEVPSPEAAFADAKSGASQAPLIPATEQTVAAQNATAQKPNLFAIYPREGSLNLDFPVLQVGGTTPDQASSEAVAMVVKALTSARARTVASEAGFRTPGGTPKGEGIRPEKTKSLGEPQLAEVNDMLSRLQGLAAPARVLAVLDVSTSMGAKLNDGLTRIELAGGAARLGANLLPDSSLVGAWVFAANMKGGKDYTELAPLKRLGDRAATGESNRSYLLRLATNVKRYLTPGGTSLYDTTLAAFRQMHEDYDPRTSNAIILLSDGANQDGDSVSLNALVAEIKKLNQGTQQVEIYTAGLGPDADYAALRKIARASGGYDYRIDTALEGQKALLDGLRRSRKIGKASTPPSQP